MLIIFGARSKLLEVKPRSNMVVRWKSRIVVIMGWFIEQNQDRITWSSVLSLEGKLEERASREVQR